MTAGEVTDLDELAAELFRLTRLFERAHARNTAQARDGVERAAYLLLAHLVREGPRRLSALADAVHSDVSTVSRQASQLVKLGLVERRPDPSDGRAGLLAATEAGVDVFEAKRHRRNEAFDAMLAGWLSSDRRRLGQLVGRFNDDFESYFLGERLGDR
ncbi:MAG TPA: MarR family transcriptional regulator [Pseudonocardia sp.]|jgi:DNA-binding MarR family transcriptional regulator|uniref:MarR family winged helix-turn-helix transcriptional regulator n=1 Tax=Pseudonocardia sp. TaxID=60912 RepID=UPI002F3F2A10